MKKDKEWLEEEVAELVRYIELKDRQITYEAGASDMAGHISKLIDQLDEPTKVVIPEFIVDYILERKLRDYDAYQAVSYSYEYDENVVSKWLHTDLNLYKFVNAWVNGYEVEEKKYYVVLDAKHALCKFAEGVFGVYEEDTDKLMFDEDFKLTEQEIKDYDSRYWAFAEEVEK